MSRARHRSPRPTPAVLPETDRYGPVLLACAALLLAWGAWVCWPRTVDDAFITFRYARNLVEGLGPVFNPGERVEGYSSPTWLLIMAGTLASGIDPVPTSKGLGIAAAASLVGMLYLRLRQASVGGGPAGLAALLLGSSFLVWLWSVAGLETTAYALLFFGGVTAVAARPATARGTALASGWLTAAALTRPQGLAFWGLGGLLVALSRPDTEERPAWRARLRLATAYALPGLVLVAHLAWRVAYYGSPVPNTFYAKTGGGPAMWWMGLAEIREFIGKPSLLLAALLAGIGLVLAVREPAHRRRAGVIGGAVLLHLLYVVQVGGDGLYVHRFLVPVLPLLALLFGLGFGATREPERRPWIRGAAALAVLAAATFSLVRLHTNFVPRLERAVLPYLEGNIELGRHLATTRPRRSLIAVAAAGAIPFYSGLPSIDMYGLNDAHIARVPFPDSRGTRMMKWDVDYVLLRRPDLIVVNRGYFPPGIAVESLLRNPRPLIVAPMDLALFRAVARDPAYRLTPLRLPSGSNFMVFERIRTPQLPLGTTR